MGHRQAAAEPVEHRTGGRHSRRRGALPTPGAGARAPFACPRAPPAGGARGARRTAGRPRLRRWL
eukprot:8300754-Lingulodinium_polyedra.AAC.1